LIGCYPAGTFLAALPSIWFAKRFGVKLTVFVGLAVLGLSTAAFPILSVSKGLSSAPAGN
jgi:fucose permease